MVESLNELREELSENQHGSLVTEQWELLEYLQSQLPNTKTMNITEEQEPTNQCTCINAEPPGEVCYVCGKLIK